MELNETAAALIYVLFFAAFLTIVLAQNMWFKVTVTGLDTLSELEVNLANEFFQSPCFTAKDEYGGLLLNTLSATALDEATTPQDMPTTKAPDEEIYYAETISKDCVDTKEYYYYIEIYEPESPNHRWIFGTSPRLLYLIPSKWTTGKKVALLKRGSNTVAVNVLYGFGTTEAEPFGGTV